MYLKASHLHLGCFPAMENPQVDIVVRPKTISEL